MPPIPAPTRVWNISPIKNSIRLKVAHVITLVTMLSLLFSMALVYIVGIRVLKNETIKDYLGMAGILASNVSRCLNEEVADAVAATNRLVWISACEEANLRYKGMGIDSIERYMLDMDKKWSDTDRSDNMMARYLDNESAVMMRNITHDKLDVPEIFITDRMGGLVAASGKTSDFYQADETWWQGSYNDGKGAVYVGDMGLDASSNVYGITIAVPVRRDRDVVGICKMIVSYERIFGPIKSFYSDKTGHAMIVDRNGHIIFHKEGMPMLETDLKPDTMNSLVRDKEIALSSLSIHNPATKALVALHKIDFQYFDKDTMLFAVVEIDMDEALNSVNQMIPALLIVVLLSIFITLPIGLFFGNLLIKPIKALSAAADRIAAGDLDYKISVHTGDELEQFAETFKNMIFALKESQYKLSKSKADLEKITKDQKRAISDKTRDLARAQEATLNILEDLVEAKNNLEKYSKDLERAVQIKTDFTATVSHELRTPLAAIKEGIAIVADGTAGGVNDRQKEFLNIAKRNVDRLTRLINDVLDFQKLEAGRMEMDMKYNDINEVITDVGDTMSTIAQGKGLEFELDLEDGLPMARFDKDKIIQAISNIVSNALRYTDKGGIKISTEKKGDSIRIAISDTGIGIKESDKQKLFKRFSQLEPISERRVGGTGLGLAISKDIVDAHNGNIDVVSKPGEGSTFTITLPINGG